MKNKDYKRIAALNEQCFGSGDAFSEYKNLKAFIENKPKKRGLILKKRSGHIVGYLLWTIDNNIFLTARRGIDYNFRGKGYGTKLTHKAIKKAKKLGFAYTTNTGIDNLASINSSIKCGCTIARIIEDIVYLECK